ncbi:MAG: 50S ribosomal protein L3 [Elusimicrobia bacterium]|nr:50S ribosomal protein L3 [Elusimicrobiota bacterium]
MRAIIGEKVGMTQLFTAQGEVVPVTAVKAGPCPVVALRGRQKEGYSAAQIGYGALRQKNASKPLLGQFKKAGVEPVRLLKEFHLADGKDFQVGQYVTLEGLFKPGDYVDVRGISKGKGFAGGMKRHGFRGGPASHGQSDRARAPGSLASRRSLGRVLPGQRMAGHLGAEWVSVQKLEVAEVTPQQNMIYIKGALPGSNRSLVIIQETVKSAKFKRVAPVAQPQAAKKAPKAAKPEKGGGKAAKPAAKAEKGEKKK